MAAFAFFEEEFLMPKVQSAAKPTPTKASEPEVHTPSLSEMVRQRNEQRIKDAEDSARLSKVAVKAVTQELKEL